MVRTQTGRMNFSPEIDRGGAYLPDDPFPVRSISSNLFAICRVSVLSRIDLFLFVPFDPSAIGVYGLWNRRWRLLPFFRPYIP